MAAGLPRFLKTAVIVLIFGGLYLLAVHRHAERDAQRQAAVELTPACKTKLEEYALSPGDEYRSPYLLKTSGRTSSRHGYSEADVRAIQRGCNIVDDMLGQQSRDGTSARWNSSRYSRSKLASCDHCHQGLGDKQDAKGNRLVGSNGLAASWVMADMYDRFTGLLLPYEMRQMQCYINSSNGFKPNAADDLIRDVTAYSRFLAAALDLRVGNRYPEQGIDEITVSETSRRGDDYVRGAHEYRQHCAVCHGSQGFGKSVDGRVLYPALAGPDAFNLDSRMNFARVNSVMPGFICRNMPPGREGSLSSQQCRDIAYYLGTLPRPAGDKQGPMTAAWQQLMMAVMPPLTLFAERLSNNGTPGASE